jgi:hypothetical protein
MRSPRTSALPSQSVDEYALMEACYETASRAMFDSEPEPSKIKEVADKFFQIAKDYLGAVPKAGDHNVVVRADSPQNFAVGVFSAPHCGQPRGSTVPHSEQNFLPVVLSVPQFKQRIA